MPRVYGVVSSIWPGQCVRALYDAGRGLGRSPAHQPFGDLARLQGGVGGGRVVEGGYGVLLVHAGAVLGSHQGLARAGDL